MDENTNIIEVMKAIKAEAFFDSLGGGALCCDADVFEEILVEYRNVIGIVVTPLEKRVNALKRKLALANLATCSGGNEHVLKFAGFKDMPSAREKVDSLTIQLANSAAMLQSNSKQTKKEDDEPTSFYETLALVSVNAGFKLSTDIDLLSFLYLTKALKESNKTKQ